MNPVTGVRCWIFEATYLTKRCVRSADSGIRCCSSSSRQPALSAKLSTATSAPSAVAVKPWPVFLQVEGLAFKVSVPS